MDDRPRHRSRRAALRALGVGTLAATAGCLFGRETDGSATDSKTSDTTPNGERTPRTTTQEQSIPTTAPAAATKTPEPTATPTFGATRTTTRPPESTSTTRTPDPTTATGAATATGWTEQTPLPVVGSDAGGGVLEGRLHFFGGIETGVGLAAVARTFAYDPTAGTRGAWERLPDLPRRLWGPCGVATDDALYSFGGAPTDGPYEGDSPSDAVFRYRPGEGWTELDVRCPYPNWVMGGVYNPKDGLIYCLGGGTGDHDAATATDHGSDGDVPGTYDERRLWTFDPAAEQVADADLARMPAAKRWPTVALFSVDDTQYLHAIGGLSGTTGPTDSNFRYDLDAGEFERAQSLPRSGTYATHSNPVIGGRAYLTHGMFWEGESTVERYKPIAHRYDPVEDGFETDLPEPTHLRGGATSGVIDGTLYVVGGHIKRFEQNGLHDCVAHNEAYTPARE
ncbi:Kelch repeat-containing protein [Halococcus sp. AFM35]|uniref:Kelch repeat-containing protein n=1 Tax=Halococcus sp. AFM35 TaxID=3421653 RepID=UPI003EBAA097